MQIKMKLIQQYYLDKGESVTKQNNKKNKVQPPQPRRIGAYGVRVWAEPMGIGVSLVTY